MPSGDPPYTRADLGFSKGTASNVSRSDLNIEHVCLKLKHVTLLNAYLDALRLTDEVPCYLETKYLEQRMHADCVRADIAPKYKEYEKESIVGPLAPSALAKDLGNYDYQYVGHFLDHLGCGWLPGEKEEVKKKIVEVAIKGDVNGLKCSDTWDIMEYAANVVRTQQLLYIKSLINAETYLWPPSHAQDPGALGYGTAPGIGCFAGHGLDKVLRTTNAIRPWLYQDRGCELGGSHGPYRSVDIGDSKDWHGPKERQTHERAHRVSGEWKLGIRRSFVALMLLSMLPAAAAMEPGDNVVRLQWHYGQAICAAAMAGCACFKLEVAPRLPGLAMAGFAIAWPQLRTDARTKQDVLWTVFGFWGVSTLAYSYNLFINDAGGQAYVLVATMLAATITGLLCQLQRSGIEGFVTYFPPAMSFSVFAVAHLPPLLGLMKRAFSRMANAFLALEHENDIEAAGL